MIHNQEVKDVETSAVSSDEMWSFVEKNRKTAYHQSFHSVLHLIDASYQLIRQKRGTHKDFFQDIVTLTKYLCFESWEHLLEFMLSDKPVPANSC